MESEFHVLYGIEQVGRGPGGAPGRIVCAIVSRGIPPRPQPGCAPLSDEQGFGQFVEMLIEESHHANA
jgi:hypothetical protein